MSEVKDIKRKLISARKAIDFAIELLGEVREPESVVADAICLYCEDPMPPDTAGPRGIHSKCYHAAGRDVRKGLITWEEIEAAGRCLPPAASGRKPKDRTDLIVGIKSAAAARNKKR